VQSLVQSFGRASCGASCRASCGALVEPRAELRAEPRAELRAEPCAEPRADVQMFVLAINCRDIYRDDCIVNYTGV
jgi:hypothetical protein